MRTLSAALGLTLALCSGGCADTAPTTPTPAPAGPASQAPAGPAVELGFSGQTTEGRVALRNLSAQIDSLGARLAAQPDRVDLRGQLMEALISRASFAGSYDDFDRLATLAEGTAPALRARYLGVIHEFRTARPLLEAEGAPVDGVLLALGEDLQAVVAARRARAEAAPGFATHADLAVALAEAGAFDDADAAYLRALEAYRDVSPFPVAWVAFQRGVMWAEHADQPEKALPLYEEAVRRLPGYVRAHVHLAEMLAQRGEQARALGLLVAVVGGGDPEPAGLLAELLADTEPEQAAAFAAQGAARYEVLLRKYPKAFADHGSEFFAGPGKDPRRALALALANLAERKTDRAYLLVIEAALAAQDLATACRVVAEAGDGRPHVPLKALRAQVADRHCR